MDDRVSALLERMFLEKGCGMPSKRQDELFPSAQLRLPNPLQTRIFVDYLGQHPCRGYSGFAAKPREGALINNRIGGPPKL